MHPLVWRTLSQPQQVRWKSIPSPSLVVASPPPQPMDWPPKNFFLEEIALRLLQHQGVWDPEMWQQAMNIFNVVVVAANQQQQQHHHRNDSAASVTAPGDALDVATPLPLKYLFLLFERMLKEQEFEPTNQQQPYDPSPKIPPHTMIGKDVSSSEWANEYLVAIVQMWLHLWKATMPGQSPPTGRKRMKRFRPKRTDALSTTTTTTMPLDDWSDDEDNDYNTDDDDDDDNNNTDNNDDNNTDNNNDNDNDNNNTDNRHHHNPALFFTSPQAILEWIDAIANTTTTTTTASKSSSSSSSGPRSMFTPTAEIYSLIMEASIFSKVPKSADHGFFLELLLNRMLQADAAATFAPAADAATTTTTATATEETTTAKRSKVRSEATTAHEAETSLIPSSYHYQKVIQAHVRKRRMYRAEKLLDRLIKLYEKTASSMSSSPSTSSHTDHRWYPVDALRTILQGWTEHLREPARASALLKRIVTRAKRLSSSSNDARQVFVPEKEQFEVCLNAWMNSRRSDAGERAELLLLQMLDLADNGHPTKPCAKSFNKVINAWTSSRHKNGAARGERILRMVQSLEPHFDWHSKPTALASIYNGVIRAIAHTEEEDAPEKCMFLLNEVKTEVGFKNVTPSLPKKLYANVMKAWARSNRTDAAEQAQALFDEMMAEQVLSRPHRLVYNALADCWARVGNADRAEAILMTMLLEFKQGNPDCAPDNSSFNAVLNAFSRCKDPGASERAESVFRLMKTLQEQYKHIDNSNAVLSPDSVTYTFLLWAMSSATDIETSRRGQQYFRQLQQLYHAGDKSCRPTIITYTMAIRLWSNIQGNNNDRNEAFENAQALLDEMIQLAEAGDESLYPNEDTYISFVSVLKNSSVPFKNQRVEEVHKKLNELRRSTRKRLRVT